MFNTTIHFRAISKEITTSKQGRTLLKSYFSAIRFVYSDQEIIRDLEDALYDTLTSIANHRNSPLDSKDISKSILDQIGSDDNAEEFLTQKPYYLTYTDLVTSILLVTLFSIVLHFGIVSWLLLVGITLLYKMPSDEKKFFDTFTLLIQQRVFPLRDDSKTKEESWTQKTKNAIMTITAKVSSLLVNIISVITIIGGLYYLIALCLQKFNLWPDVLFVRSDINNLTTSLFVITTFILVVCLGLFGVNTYRLSKVLDKSYLRISKKLVNTNYTNCGKHNAF